MKTKEAILRDKIQPPFIMPISEHLIYEAMQEYADQTCCNKWVDIEKQMPGKNEAVDLWNGKEGKRLADMRYMGNSYFNRGCIWKAKVFVTHWAKINKPIIKSK